MRRNSVNGAVSSSSFRSAGSDVESEIPSTSVSGGQAGSVLMVRGTSARGTGEDHDCLSEENLKYLPLGIQEINEDGKNVTSISEAETYWATEHRKDGKQNKRPYKREAIDKSMASALNKGVERRDVILSSLKSMGITAFIIDSQHAATTPEVMEHVLRVITFVGKENRTFAPAVFQRCLLYQDGEGLLYNLVLPKYSAGLACKWQEYVDSFSAFQATLAFALLLRSLPCAEEDEMQGQLKPAYLALIVGLVLAEEVSLSWTNTVMMVQACPSISAYSVTKDFGSDWIRKGIIVLLALAGATNGKTQVLFITMGILLTCAVLLANLGARAWYFFQWQPLSYSGPLSSLLAYMSAVLTGLALPFLGHRISSIGGKPAIESILRIALMIAIAFVISDFRSVRKFIIVGTGSCNQDTVNTFVGIWLSLSLMASICIAGKVKPIREYPSEEPLLEEDHQSPVGYRVPNLPDFPIDPHQGKKGIILLPLKVELSIAVVGAVVIGAGFVALAKTDWGERTEKQVFDFF